MAAGPFGTADVMARCERAAAGRPGRATVRGRLATVRLAAGAAALAVLGAGCADLPGSGAVQYTSTSTQLGPVQPQDRPQQIPVPPIRGSSPVGIVDGFLTASGSFVGDHAVAREYLTPRAASKWHPGWAATVLKQLPTVRLVSFGKNVPGAGSPAQSSAQSAAAKVTGPSLARLTGAGQYLQVDSGAQVKPFQFSLEKIAGQWRISRLPSRQSLILLQGWLADDYVPRNLYFYTQSGSLVPDPVFVPQQQSPDEPATGLVRGLLQQSPDGWLSNAATTSFPTGTTLLGVSITATNAVVDLGGTAARASPQVLLKMEAQIVWTLTSRSYSPSAITSVQLKINGKPVTQKLLLQQQFSTCPAAAPRRPGSCPPSRRWLPGRPASRVYYLDKYGKIGVLGPGAQRARLAWPVRARLTRIAVAPGGDEVAGIVPRRGGCSVITGPPGRHAQVLSRLVSGGDCTALSADGPGNIWVAAGSHVWFLPEAGGVAQPVITQGLSPADTITALRVAPDNVRVAMIVKSPAGWAEIFAGAISHSGTVQHGQLQIGPQMQTVGPGVPHPAALTWYSADDILVLSDAGRPSSQLYDVPLNNGIASFVPTPPGDVATVTTIGSETGPAGPLIVGTTQGDILGSAGPDSSWTSVTRGTAPVYPG